MTSETEPMTREQQRLRRIALTRAQQHRSAHHIPRKPTRIPRLFPSPAAVIALVIVLIVAFAVAMMRPHAHVDRKGGDPGPDAPLSQANPRGDTSSPQQADPSAHAPRPADEGAEKHPSPSVPTLLIVQVSGAVNHPGVVELPAGSRGIDAVEVAGGLSNDADLASVNLASPLVDGQHIHVNEVGTAVTHTSQDNRCIDIRSADETRMQDLTGIGPALAARIVEHRSAHPFTSVTDLQNVSGIGAKTFERIKDQLCP